MSETHVITDMENLRNIVLGALVKPGLDMYWHVTDMESSTESKYQYVHINLMNIRSSAVYQIRIVR